MEKSGTTLIFDINKVSLLDINHLIDKGWRFRLEQGLDEEEYDDVEAYLKDDNV